MATLFENEQWLITEEKLTAVAGFPGYDIHGNRLLETSKRGSESVYFWPVHMAPKTWVDISAFHNAFIRALSLLESNYDGSVDQDMLDRSLAIGRGIANARAGGS